MTLTRDSDINLEDYTAPEHKHSKAPPHQRVKEEMCTSCLLLSVCEDGKVVGGVASDDFG